MRWLARRAPLDSAVVTLALQLITVRGYRWKSAQRKLGRGNARRNPAQASVSPPSGVAQPVLSSQHDVWQHVTGCQPVMLARAYCQGYDRGQPHSRKGPAWSLSVTPTAAPSAENGGPHKSHCWSELRSNCKHVLGLSTQEHCQAELTRPAKGAGLPWEFAVLQQPTPSGFMFYCLGIYHAACYFYYMLMRIRLKPWKEPKRWKQHHIPPDPIATSLSKETRVEKGFQVFQCTLVTVPTVLVLDGQASVWGQMQPAACCALSMS